MTQRCFCASVGCCERDGNHKKRSYPLQGTAFPFGRIDASRSTRFRRKANTRQEKQAALADLQSAFARGDISEEEYNAAKAAVGQYSVEKTADGKRYVRAERQVIFGNDPQSWSEQLEDYINGKIRRGQDVHLTAADGDILTLTATSAGKLSDNHTSDGRTMSETAYERKANAAAHIDELAEVSRADGKVKKDRDGRHGAMASGGWSYRTAYFEDFDGKYYEVTISVAESADGKMVYNIGQMKEEASPKVKGSRAISDDGLRGFASSGDSITESGQNVKRQFSYAGEQAKTADIESLKNAQEMEKLGADMESIRKATGWHMGKDGKWRFEIDDSGMEYRRNGDARLTQEEGYRRLDELTRKWADHYEKGGEALTEAESAEMEALQEEYSDRVWEEKYMLRDFLRHDELFEAYPRLNGVSLAFDSLDDGQKGYFDKRSNTIVLSDNLIGSEESTLLHEVQHVIQKLEGFSQGSSPAYWARRDAETGAIKRRLEQERANIFEGLSREEQNKYTRYQELERELERLSDAEDGTEDGERYLRYDRKSDELYLELWGKDWFQKLGTLDRKLGSGLGEEYTRLYRNTAGEVEARDTASRRKLTSEQRRETAPDYGNENTVLAEDAGNGYSISETEDGRAVAVVDSDILAHIDTSSWNDTKKAQAKTAAKTALLAFKDGIRVNGIDYKVNKRSRDEYTRSNDTEHTYRAKPDAFADKMRAAANADDIITATTSWARDGSLKHPRTDSFVDFAHGDVLLQAGENQYTARAVVGITDSGEYVFYDVVDMTPASFDTKKERLSTAALDKNDLSAIQENLSSRSITENSGDVKRQYSVSEEKAETQEAEKAKKKAKSFTRDDLPKKAQGYLKRTEKTPRKILKKRENSGTKSRLRAYI